MATSARPPRELRLHLLTLAAAARICSGQIQAIHGGQLYQLPQMPGGSSYEVGPYGGAPTAVQGSGEPLAEVITQPGEQLASFVQSTRGTFPQGAPARYPGREPARYAPEPARYGPALGSPAEVAHYGRLASVGGNPASFAAASNLQRLRGEAEGWRQNHESLDEAISALRKYLENPLQDKQFQQPQRQEAMASWEPSEVLLQRRDALLPVPEEPMLQNAVLSYELTRQAPQRPGAALLELSSTEELLGRTVELMVAQHPGVMMLASVVLGVMLALCCILNRARLERGRDHLSEEPGQAGCIFFFLMFASAGFGSLWCYGLIQPYWKPLLVGGYVMLTGFWLAGIVCLQVSKSLMEQRPPNKAEGRKLPWGEADSCEAHRLEAEGTPLKRKDSRRA